MDRENIRLMNTAGECKYLHQVCELACSAVTDIRVGAMTAQDGERLGNRKYSPSGIFFWVDEKTGNGLNTLGLPNPGRLYYKEYLPRMVAIAEQAGKRLGANISSTGESDDEYPTLAELCVESGVHTIEVDVGCPSVWSGGKQKPIASYNPDAVAAVLRSIRNVVAGASVEVDVKLSPLIVLPPEPLTYSPDMTLPPLDEELVKEIGAVINEAGYINAAVSINTVPNVFALDEKGGQRLSTQSGVGGLSGPIIHDLSLAQNKLLRAVLLPHIECYGVGGVNKGQDVLDLVDVGVGGVQVGTHWMRFGSRAFGEIFRDYAGLLEKRSVSSS